VTEGGSNDPSSGTSIEGADGAVSFKTVQRTESGDSVDLPATVTRKATVYAQTVDLPATVTRKVS
jgi:hypothetical protein